MTLVSSSATYINSENTLSAGTSCPAMAPYGIGGSGVIAEYNNTSNINIGVNAPVGLHCEHPG